MKHKIKNVFYGLLVAALSASCSTKELVIPSVGYQSVRTSYAQPTEIPKTAKIATQYFINADGEVFGVIYNLTDEIITIDQTKSFLINTDGHSLSFFDPNIYTTTEGQYSSTTKNSTFNLGAIANAFNIGGTLGALLSGTTVGSSVTSGTFSQNSVTYSDQPQVRIGPHGRIALSKQFASGIGQSKIKDESQSFCRQTSDKSPMKFSVCVSYTIGETGTPEKLVTNFYVNDNIVVPVHSQKVNTAIRQIYNQKRDALAENYFILKINSNLPEGKGRNSWQGKYNNAGKVISTYIKGSLIDYQ